ncbi:MAG TPA: phosphotransferase [Candidatus Sulfomarinibacteraceae bacterium]|nr:phosphotransferase [Candidatus Sulfomarinibacteraceae bacterium]
MKRFEALTQRGQVARLRQLAENALEQYAVEVTDLAPLVHLENTTFRIANSVQDFVLRINRPDHRTRAEIESETMWLAAIHRDTDLVVPEPVANEKGEFVTRAGANGVPEARNCVLFKWVDGQFYRKRLSPVALRRIGRLTALLHEHAIHYEPPPGFTRHNVQWGTEDEPGEMARLMEKGLSGGAAIIEPQDLATFTLARYHLRETMAAVDRGKQEFGLIHADLHHGNCLFKGGEARAIDFDDCGWGHFVYDLAVTQWYLQARPDFAELCKAQLSGYQEIRPLDREQLALIPTYRAARTLLMASYMAGRHDNPELRERAPQFIASCAMALRDYLAEQGADAV